MKKFGKVLLIFALVAIMLSTVLPFAMADEEDDGWRKPLEKDWDLDDRVWVDPYDHDHQDDSLPSNPDGGTTPCTHFNPQFKGFVWKITQDYSWSNQEVKSVKAGFQCPACKLVCFITATVNGKNIVTASISDIESLDGYPHREIKEINHEWVFQVFDWDLTDYSADAICVCSGCGETHAFDSYMEYSYNTAIAKYYDEDGTLHREIINPDFGKYQPYSWDLVNGYYEYQGFEWIGNNKASVCYKYYTRVGCGDLGYEIVKVDAVVTRKTQSLASQTYTAKLAYWQTPDRVERVETKTFSLSDNPNLGKVSREKIIIKPVDPRPIELKPVQP